MEGAMIPGCRQSSRLKIRFGRHIVTSYFHSVQVDNSAVTNSRKERKVLIPPCFGDIKLMTKIGRDRFLAWIWTKTDHGSFIVLPVSKLTSIKLPFGPRNEINRSPRGSLIRTVVQIMEVCAKAKRKASR